ncbi:MAG: HAMP domain-containing histidine kinase [Anaerolineae bacterium]|nr:HAMP domain-containing histidine kinase [Anaerolineae bacterium]
MDVQHITTDGKTTATVDSLLRATPYPVILLNVTQQLTAWNAPARDLFALTGDTQPNLADLPGGDRLVQWLSGTQDTVEWALSEEIRYRPYVEPIGDREQPLGWVMLLRDMTERQRLVRSQAEYIRLISHDLRTPLTSVVGFASMLQQLLIGDELAQPRHFVNKIISGLNVLTGLLENIQDAGRFDPETGFYEMSRTMCDPGEIVQRIIKNYPMPADKPDLRVRVTIDDDVPVFAADTNMLERAVSNLFDNAVKYTPNGSAIDVHVQRSGDEVIIAVRDSGLGIPPEDQQRLFQRHTRVARKEFKKIKGTGLGLFIVRSVAQHHGGRAWVESESGQGSCFYLALPVVTRPTRQD